MGNNICKILERDCPEIEVTKVKCDEIYTDEGLNPFLIDKFDYIIQGAGYGQPQMFGKDKVKTISINTTLTNDLFSYLKPDGKFLFISTAEVYSGAPSPHKETDIGTTTPQHPRACYIEGKRCGEAICMAYKEQGYDVKIARLALAYGEGTKKGDTRAINQIIEQALTKKNIKLFDDGSAIRTYCYVQDAAEMMLQILFKGKDVVYNVGGISTTTIYDLAEMIGHYTGKRVIRGSNPLTGSPDSVELSLVKVLQEFPRTFVSLKEGIKKTIEYQKELYGK